MEGSVTITTDRYDQFKVYELIVLALESKTEFVVDMRMIKGNPSYHDNHYQFMSNSEDFERKIKELSRENDMWAKSANEEMARLRNELDKFKPVEKPAPKKSKSWF